MGNTLVFAFGDGKLNEKNGNYTWEKTVNGESITTEVDVVISFLKDDDIVGKKVIGFDTFKMTCNEYKCSGHDPQSRTYKFSNFSRSVRKGDIQKYQITSQNTFNGFCFEVYSFKILYNITRNI